MKVFLSWSGGRAKQVAIAFRDWLPMILHYTKPWMSDHDIEAGSRWLQEVSGELNNSNFGIIFLTSENLSAPWLLFEGGALSKAVEESRVVPLLIDGLDPSQVSGPLAQFQAKRFTKDGVANILKSMNAAKVEGGVPPSVLDELHAALWPRLEAIGSQKPTGIVKKLRSDTEMLEEVLITVRRLESASRKNAPATLGAPFGEASKRFLIFPVNNTSYSNVRGAMMEAVKSYPGIKWFIDDKTSELLVYVDEFSEEDKISIQDFVMSRLFDGMRGGK